MLLEKINSLSTYYKVINKAKKIKNESENYRLVNLKLQDSLKRLNSVILVFSHLSINDKYKRENLFVDKPDFSSVMQVIDQMSEKIITKSEAERILNLLKEIEKPIREQWEKYSIENSKNAISLIEMIKPLIGYSARFTLLLDDLKSFKNSWPVTEKEIISFKKKLDSCEEDIKNLEITEGIMHFLIKVLNGNATINDLDQSIINWSRNHDFSSKLEIKFRKNL